MFKLLTVRTIRETFIKRFEHGVAKEINFVLIGKICVNLIIYVPLCYTLSKKPFNNKHGQSKS